MHVISGRETNTGLIVDGGSPWASTGPRAPCQGRSRHTQLSLDAAAWAEWWRQRRGVAAVSHGLAMTGHG